MTGESDQLYDTVVAIAGHSVCQLSDWVAYLERIALAAFDCTLLAASARDVSADMGADSMLEVRVLTVSRARAAAGSPESSTMRADSDGLLSVCSTVFSEAV